jgi:hypothetical protein
MDLKLKSIFLIVLIVSLLGCISEETSIQTNSPLTTLLPETVAPPPLESVEPSTPPKTMTRLPQTTAAPIETPATKTPFSDTPVPTEKPTSQAHYKLTFTATWSDETHPYDFPSNPHFSPLIGASHSPLNLLWKEGEKATPGIKNMAENGVNSPLDGEIESRIDEGSVCELISGRSLSPSPGVVELNFKMDPECPLVTIVSMIAPSPDWFVGVNSLSLNANGDWIKQKVVELFPYDAGTDSGRTYTSPDEPTSSPEVIHRIEEEAFFVDGTVPPMGTFTFTRLDN